MLGPGKSLKKGLLFRQEKWEAVCDVLADHPHRQFIHVRTNDRSLIPCQTGSQIIVQKPPGEVTQPSSKDVSFKEGRHVEH